MAAGGANQWQGVGLTSGRGWSNQWQVMGLTSGRGWSNRLGGGVTSGR